jgi:hypothetical protein
MLIRRFALRQQLPFSQRWRTVRHQAPFTAGRLRVYGELLQALTDTLLNEGLRSNEHRRALVHLAAANRPRTITAESEGLGRGSEFPVRLPIGAPSQDRSVAKSLAAPNVDTERMTILVVESYPESREMLKALAIRCGWPMTCRPPSRPPAFIAVTGCGQVEDRLQTAAAGFDVHW